jgi:pectate lyase
MKIKILLPLVFIVILFSCKKNKEDGYNCGVSPKCYNILCVAFLSNFSFTVVDKTTGNDLIFGNNTTLTPGDIKLFVKQNSPYTAITTFADSTKKTMATVFARDTMALQIKNEPLKFITVKTFCSRECCGTNAVEIIYDGNLLVADAENVIKIKR